MSVSQTMIGFNGKVGFAIGTGRCGTSFVAKAVGLEPRVSSTHERNAFNETFHRYCKWYDLPVDDEGFLQQKEVEIRKDLEDHSYSFEASAYLSISVQELYDRFGAKFLLLVRSPERVANSFYHKGWYASPATRKNPDLPPGYQECESFHHFLARFMPSGEKFIQWNEMSRTGKLAWFWNAMNARILEQFAQIPKSHWRIEKIENFTYDRYLQIADFLGYEVTVTRQAYRALADSRPNRVHYLRTIADWNSQEIAEFEAEVAPMAERLGYEYRVDRLPVPQPWIPEPEPPKPFSIRLRRRLAKWVGKLEASLSN